MHPLDEFKRDVGGYLPGVIALYDIADAKRRNFHLGHQVVDGEIEEVDRLIRSSAALARRVAGDEWLAVYRTQSIEPLAAILRVFHKEQEFRVGWKSTGEKDGEVKVAEETVTAKVVRSLRCLYAFAANPDETNALIDQLRKQNWGLPPNIPHSLADAETLTKSSWDCVTSYPPASPFCPFCRGRDFDWQDGGTGVYDATGICRTCKVSVDITGIERFS